MIDSIFFFTVSTATIFCDQTTPSFEMSVYFCMFFQLAQFCPEILPSAAKETQALTTTHQGDSDTPAEQHVCDCHILLQISLFHLKMRFYFFIFSLARHSARVLDWPQSMSVFRKTQLHNPLQSLLVLVRNRKLQLRKFPAILSLFAKMKLYAGTKIRSSFFLWKTCSRGRRANSKKIEEVIKLV